MGLDIKAKGLSGEKSFSCGYITFGRFRMELAKTYNQRIGELYEISYSQKLTEQQSKEYDRICNDDLDIFLWHSDCDGKLTPQECKKIYNAIKDFKMDMQGHNYGIMQSYNMLEQWKNIFKHCYQRRVNLYFY